MDSAGVRNLLQRPDEVEEGTEAKPVTSNVQLQLKSDVPNLSQNY